MTARRFERALQWLNGADVGYAIHQMALDSDPMTCKVFYKVLWFNFVGIFLITRYKNKLPSHVADTFRSTFCWGLAHVACLHHFFMRPAERMDIKPALTVRNLAIKRSLPRVICGKPRQA